MSVERLRALAEQLSDQGIDVSELLRLEPELEAVELPPSRWSAMTKAVKERAVAQWGLAVKEWSDTRRVGVLLAKRARGTEKWTPEELAELRAQVADFLRIVPAGLITATNSTLPIPGTSIMTPWLLRKLGLMPSSWREARLLAKLNEQSRLLRSQGLSAAAEQVAELQKDLEREAIARERCAQTALLPYWDENDNGIWDAEERMKYQVEVDKLLAYADRFSHQRKWYFQLVGQVFGPVVLSKMPAEADAELLVCWDGTSRWIAWKDMAVALNPHR